MEPTEALRSIETALRNAVRYAHPNGAWQSLPGAPDVRKLEQRREEERKRREGAVVSSDVLDYTETYHLTELIKKNWESFSRIFKDKSRTLTYLGIVEDIRNGVAHSRELVSFERDLLSGVAGQLVNQVSEYITTADGARIYYPTIETIVDGFGSGPAHYRFGDYKDDERRVDVGQPLHFSGRAVSARGKAIEWFLFTPHFARTGEVVQVGEGETLEYTYRMREDDVGELTAIHFYIVADSRFHRHPHDPDASHAAYDDGAWFVYRVNPPFDA